MALVRWITIVSLVLLGAVACMSDGDGDKQTDKSDITETTTGSDVTDAPTDTFSVPTDTDKNPGTVSPSDTVTGEDTGEEPDTTPRVGLNDGPGRDGLMGWNILQPAYKKFNVLDMISFEWDYFMVHDEQGRFTGSIGYLIANPRNADVANLGLGDLVPKGGNVAVAGKFGKGAAYLAEYKNFGPKGYTAGAQDRSFDASEVATDSTDSQDTVFAKQIPVPAAGNEQQQLLLQGQTEQFAWDLTVRQDWLGLSSNPRMFVPEQGNDIGELPIPGLNEVWNVNMLWPRTLVTGTITNRATDEVVEIDGHGYRENSWGRWAFNLGGWDFATLSDNDAKVMWTWQSYHNKSVELDYADLGFVDEDNLLTLLHFNASDGEVGWIHNEWFYDEGARQCMPLDTTVIAENDDYRVEATVTLGHEQVPMLSDATSATKNFVIEIQFPWVEGAITRKADSKVIPFAGQGGGEFANARRGAGQAVPSAAECTTWGQRFSSPLPTKGP